MPKVQVEAQLHFSLVVFDNMRFYYVLTNLPQNVIESVIDEVQTPPSTVLFVALLLLSVDGRNENLTKRSLIHCTRQVLPMWEVGSKL